MLIEAKITLTDGSTWHAVEKAGHLTPVIVNVDDEAREMTSAQWSEFAVKYMQRNSARVAEAKRKQRELNRALLERDIAARKQSN